MAATGLYQWVVWGTTPPPTGVLGIVTGGNYGNEDPDVRIRTGAGGIRKAVGGLWKGSPDLTYLVTSSNHALVGYSFRDAYPRGDLTSLCLKGGDADGGDYFTSCYVDEANISWRTGEALTCAQTFATLMVVDCVGSAQAAEPNLDFEDYTCVVTVPGGEDEAVAVEIRVANHLLPYTCGDAKSAGYERFPVGIAKGAEEVTITVRTLAAIPIATITVRDTVMDGTLTLVLTFDNGTDSFTLTADNLICTMKSFPNADNNTLAEYEYTFVPSDETKSIDWGSL